MICVLDSAEVARDQLAGAVSGERLGTSLDLNVGIMIKSLIKYFFTNHAEKNWSTMEHLENDLGSGMILMTGF